MRKAAAATALCLWATGAWAAIGHEEPTRAPSGPDWTPRPVVFVVQEARLLDAPDRGAARAAIDARAAVAGGGAALVLGGVAMLAAGLRRAVRTRRS